MVKSTMLTPLISCTKDSKNNQTTLQNGSRVITNGYNPKNPFHTFMSIDDSHDVVVDDVNCNYSMPDLIRKQVQTSVKVLNAPEGTKTQGDKPELAGNG